MSFWTRKEHRNHAAGIEGSAYSPSGGRAKQWLAGVFLAAVPVIYGVICIRRGHTTLFGERDDFDMRGDAGLWLAAAYIAAGAFLHFHYFWGLSARLLRYNEIPKILALLVFIPGFLYALFHIFTL